MTQSTFENVKPGDEVLTVYKGHVVKMVVESVYDKGHQCRSVILKVPFMDKTILRHMYAIYELNEEDKTNGN